ncbi:helix-turn-helix domain-containing protein [Phenylobacterium sp.]|uniref:helix-turn-helix domain-containing protein n=1 Tax=Phenylobacterium sp. TaxID=1871053 RepID=UPI0035B00319
MSLPGILGEIEAVAGVKVALKFAQRFGGTDIKLSAAEGSALCEALGAEAAQLIVQALGHGRVTVPMANVRGQRGRRAAVAQLVEKGLSARDAALACDVHERTVWRVKADLKHPKQPTFFDDD